MRRLIVTGDDFGMAVAVNEAVEEAHRRGILTTASLMVGEAAANDAVERAKRLPSLRVGLHLVLVDGSPVLPAEAIPDLLERQGVFFSSLVRAGIRFFLSRRVRRQLEAEIRAQFLAYQRTGLPLDHVNAHHHMHLHPTVFGFLMDIGSEYGLRAVRLPFEPLLPSWRASGKVLVRKPVLWLCLFPWVRLLKMRLRRAGIRSNDFIFGLYDDGRLGQDLVIRFLRSLPEGVTEIYFHPAQKPIVPDQCLANGGQRQREFGVLVNPVIREALQSSDIATVAFSDL